MMDMLGSVGEFEGEVMVEGREGGGKGGMGKGKKMGRGKVKGDRKGKGRVWV